MNKKVLHPKLVMPVFLTFSPEVNVKILFSSLTIGSVL
jgi:hypothetical protein